MNLAYRGVAPEAVVVFESPYAVTRTVTDHTLCVYGKIALCPLMWHYHCLQNHITKINIVFGERGSSYILHISSYLVPAIKWLLMLGPCRIFRTAQIRGTSEKKIQLTQMHAVNDAGDRHVYPRVCDLQWRHHWLTPGWSTWTLYLRELHSACATSACKLLTYQQRWHLFILSLAVFKSGLSAFIRLHQTLPQCFKKKKKLR